MIPAEFEPALDGGYIIAGSASTVRDRLKKDNETAGINYCLCRLAFGDLSFEESARSIELLATASFSVGIGEEAQATMPKAMAHHKALRIPFTVIMTTPVRCVSRALHRR